MGNKRREVIIRHAGLFGQPAETIQDIAGGPFPCHHPAYRRVHEAWRKGLQQLRQLLQDVYHSEEMTPFSLRDLAPHIDVQTTPTQQAKLDHAYAMLQTSGEKITHRRLQQVAHVTSGCIRTYLKQRACAVAVVS